MENAEKFYSKYKRGEVNAEDIHDYIAEWHNGDSIEELHEYLGMTWDEYGHWFETGELLK